MKTILFLLLFLFSTIVYAQKVDTLQVYDHICDINNLYKTDTTKFSFTNDTLVIRNIKPRKSLPKELIALRTTRSDTIVLEVINPSRLELMAECPSYQYTVKLPTISGAKIKLLIDNEFFEVLTPVNPVMGLNDLGEKVHEFLIFPNPSKGHFKMECEKGAKQIRIYNLKGQLIYEQDTKDTEINFSNFIPGLYKVTVLKNNVVKSKNLLIK